MTKRTIFSVAALLLIVVSLDSHAQAAEPNPKNYVATASGDNVALDVPDGKRCRIHLITILCTKQMSGVVGLYVHDGSAYLFGEPNGTYPIDKRGIDGPQGLSLDANTWGHLVTTVPGADVIVNLDAAQPVIVRITYTLF